MAKPWSTIVRGQLEIVSRRLYHIEHGDQVRVSDLKPLRILCQAWSHEIYPWSVTMRILAYNFVSWQVARSTVSYKDYHFREDSGNTIREVPATDLPLYINYHHHERYLKMLRELPREV